MAYMHSNIHVYIYIQTHVDASMCIRTHIPGIQNTRMHINICVYVCVCVKHTEDCCFYEGEAPGLGCFLGLLPFAQVDCRLFVASPLHTHAQCNVMAVFVSHVHAKYTHVQYIQTRETDKIFILNLCMCLCVRTN